LGLIQRSCKRFKSGAEYVPFYVSCNLDKVTCMAQPVEQFATDWTAEGANSSMGVIFCAYPDRPGVRPSLLHNRYRLSYRGVKRPMVALTTHHHLAPSLNRE